MSERTKLIVFTLLLTAVCVLGARGVLAADWGLHFGPSIQNGTTDGSSKIFGLRREEYVWEGIHTGFEGGGYVDNGGNGRKSAGLFKAQLGIKPGQKEGVFGKAFIGPCLMTTRDTVLGGFGQFCTDVGFGMRDTDSFMSIGYNHISSAGLAMPNKGRDYLVFEAGIHFD
jgi:hypothetical protein